MVYSPVQYMRISSRSCLAESFGCLPRSLPNRKRGQACHRARTRHALRGRPAGKHSGSRCNTNDRFSTEPDADFTPGCWPPTDSRSGRHVRCRIGEAAPPRRSARLPCLLQQPGRHTWTRARDWRIMSPALSAAQASPLTCPNTTSISNAHPRLAAYSPLSRSRRPLHGLGAAADHPASSPDFGLHD
jgi:hypothetical protein